MMACSAAVATDSVLVGELSAGSGAAGEACPLPGCCYLGCEIDAVMTQKARARIAAVLPFGGEIAP